MNFVKPALIWVNNALFRFCITGCIISLDLPVAGNLVCKAGSTVAAMRSDTLMKTPVKHHPGYCVDITAAGSLYLPDAE